MNRPSSPPEACLAAPSASASASLRLPGYSERLPAVDEHIARPETREEYLKGERMVAQPAKEPHALEHGDLAYLLRAYRASGYLSAVDMLTRTGPDSDFAPDASVYPEERDAETGGRKLEELAFEIVSEQPVGVAWEKTRELIKRGVRRVFCLVLKRQALLEWSREGDTWSTLSADGVIEDRCFVRPLPIRALLDASKRDGAVVRALLAKGEPELMAIREEGSLSIATQAVLTVLAARGLYASDEERARIVACRDLKTLQQWLTRAAVASAAQELFRES